VTEVASWTTSDVALWLKVQMHLIALRRGRMREEEIFIGQKTEAQIEILYSAKCEHQTEMHCI
ncbi:hypothetical protein ALC62_14909, partial [Cyphomyrmex costatus]